MKKKFSKILGVGLALVLVVSLGAFVVAPANPADASPAANKWAKFSIPSAGSLGDYILAPTDDEGVSTLQSPGGPAYLTKSKDGDLWAYWDVSEATSSNLYKSTDEGRSWIKMGSSTSVVADVEVIDIACSPEDNDVVFVAGLNSDSEYKVYKTSDGGSTWAAMPDLPGAFGAITCLDVSYKDGRHYVAAGANNGVNGEVYVKPDIAYETWEAQQMTTHNKVWDVAFSPNFATETNENVVAVTDSGIATYVRHQFGGGDWDTVKAQLRVGTGICFSGISGADIAFPDDYDSTTSGDNAELFVGIDATGATCPVEFQTDGQGGAVWSTDNQTSGSYSVKLTAPLTADYAKVKLPISEAFSSFTAPSFYYKISIDAFETNIEDIGGTWPIYVRSGETVTQGYFSPFVVIEISDGITTHWIISQQWAESTKVDWTLWDNAQASTVYSEALWHNEGFNAPPTTVGYAGWGPLSYFTDTLYPDYNVVDVGIALGNFAVTGQQSAYVDDITINGETCTLEDPTDAVFGDVYYINYTTAHDKGVNRDISSIDLDGSAGDACILAACLPTADVATRRDVMRSSDSGATWYASSQDPSGPGDAGAYVVVDDDFFDNGKAWVATVGSTNDDQSAISLTNDYGKCWIQISMINTEIDKLLKGGLAFSPVFATDETMFMITTSTGPVDSLWRWDGEYWSRVHDNDTASCDIDAVQVSPDFAESNTVYLADKGDKKVWYSKDGGFRFIKQSSGPAAFADDAGWIVLDYNTVLVGGTDKVYKATRRDGARYSTKTALFGTIMSFAVSPDYESDTTVLCGGNAGKVGLSTNGGSTWKQKPAGVKVKDTATTCYVAFDSDYATNSIIYAAAKGSQAVYRLEVDESTSWSKISDGTDTASPAEPVAFGADPSGIVAANGAVYCAVEKEVDTGTDDVEEVYEDILVSRSINPTASTTSSRGVYFEPIKTSFTGTIGNTTGLWLTGGSSNILWTEETVAVGGTTNAIWKYEDALIVAPTLTEPEDTSSTGRTGTATLKWEKMDGASRYVIWVSSNEDFSPLFGTWTDTNKVSSTASYGVSDLTAGKTYYWKMRSADSVSSLSTLRGRALSPWSEVWSFTTGIAGGEWNPFVTATGFAGNVAPQPGAQGVILSPSFQWNAADWATGYEFVLADNTGFTSPIKEFVGADALTTAVYALDTNLAYSTEYYWKVRAISDTSESIWATGVFTTMAKPVEAPAPVVVEEVPAPPAPVLPIAETPAYVWAIIAIGAVLVIALIVLIVRTRRAV